MPKVNHKGYQFHYDKERVWVKCSQDYNFADPDCLEALQIALSKREELLDKSKRRAYVYVGIGNPIYSAEDEYAAYKIGSAYNPEERHMGGMHTIIIKIPVATRSEAYRLEAQLHQRFNDRLFRHNIKEWFALTDDDLAYLRRLADKE